jgi:DNA polymerase elongation subunit (family B)
MGYTLKRRDNATIVHRIVGKAVEIAMDEQDPPKAIEFLKNSLHDILEGKYPISDFITTKTLRANYKGTKIITNEKGNAGDAGSWYWDDVNCSIAHVKLCQRIKTRDPGNCPQTNDRIPFVTVAFENSKKMLQADRIEHPDYIIANNLKIDYLFYITNQIMNPCVQFFELLTDELADIFNSIIKKENNINDNIYQKKARNEGLKKWEKYGIKEDINNIVNEDWDFGFKKPEIKEDLNNILLDHNINQNIIKKQIKKTSINKIRKYTNKHISMLITDMNQRLNNIDYNEI